jgi:ferritin-like metal-binding protein YciE
MKLETLEELLIEQLKDIYDAENQIIKALPKMSKAANATDLKRAFDEHLHQTQGQIRRLEQVFQGLGESAKGNKCEGMRGIIEEAEELMDQDASPAVRDAGLIASAQRVEHYEIACYGTVRSFARTLGHEEAAQLLQQTLNEEVAADKKLTELAEARVNTQAAEAA